MLAYIFKLTENADGTREAIYRIRELIYRPEYKNRSSSWQISERLRQTKESYVDFNVEYCDPFDSSSNYWMRLEHLGRYIWATNECLRAKAETVADIACANGYGTLMLSKCADIVYGFDRSSEYIALAPKRENIEYVLADLDKLETQEYGEKFDIITCFETIEHVKNPERLSKTLYNLLKPRGTLLLSFPNSIYEKTDEYGLNKDEYHLHIFEKKKILEILESAGFEICEILGQSYCNERCNLENDSVKAGIISAKELQKKHEKAFEDILSDARELAIPSNVNIDKSYSYILRCYKTER